MERQALETFPPACGVAVPAVLFILELQAHTSVLSPAWNSCLWSVPNLTLDAIS